MTTFKHKSFICVSGETPTQAQKDEKELVYTSALTNCTVSNQSVSDDAINCYYEFDFTCDEDETTMKSTLQSS